MADLPNGQMSPLFQAAIEATEEAIYNALLMAEDIEYPIAGSDAVVHALPVERVRAMAAARDAR
jgi:D-aminopeptidase